MGCSSGKNSVNPIESLICSGESKLLYQDCKATDVDLIHRKYTNNGRMNENQWMNVYRYLNLAQNQTAVPMSEHIKAFYHKFKKLNTYVLKEMLVLGIIHSVGTVEVKAKLLFEAFDDHDSKELVKESFGNIYDILYKINAKRVQALIDKSDDYNVTDQELREYFEKLASGKDRFREAFINTFVGEGERVTLYSFLQTMNDPKNIHLIDSSVFRSTLKGYSSKESIKNSKVDILGESGSKVVEDDKNATDIKQSE